MKIIVTGDLFSGGDIVTGRHMPEIKSDAFNSADLRITNLENPLSDSDVFASKSVLYAPLESSLTLLKNLRIDYCSLANNHIHDKGLKGIEETILGLSSVNIKCFGAGVNISEAKKPIQLEENLFMLAYCQFNSPTLNHIQLANDDTPGVNPLVLSNIFRDLDCLPEGAKVILLLHWGREHVWLTDYSNILLAKKLLDHPKVKTIIGSHPHRIQPVLKYKGKTCFFCLGNFLFPNFFIEPPKRITYSVKSDCLVTTRYHSVSRLTYKKWKIVNRISMGVRYCTRTDNLEPVYFYQNNNFPNVIEVGGIFKFCITLWLSFLRLFFLLPPKVYNIFQVFQVKLFNLQWFIGIAFFKIRQDGLKKVIKKIFNLLTARFK